MCIKAENRLYIIKMKNQATDLNKFRGYLNDSLGEGKLRIAYYNLTEKTSPNDKRAFNGMEEKSIYKCALIDYEGNEISCIYWCDCWKYEKDGNKSICCRLKFKTEDKIIIENFKYNLYLKLDEDFADNSYIYFETSKPLIEQMKKFERLFVQENKSSKYNELEEEKALSPLAQKNQYCRRKYNLKPAQQRGEFQRDYDRIIYSKAFRRMVDKAQIFSSVKGDYYRTRMTHTLIVCQIARSIAHRLNLNSSLAEAIAVGHDLGHTPFGHQGERTLHSILTGGKGFEVEGLALNNSKDKQHEFPYGGFKHNYQSVRVASCLETQYPEIDGLDLSEQTLNGMWMHTKKKAGLGIEQFSDGFLSDNGEAAFTLEGQVVAVADEIAQRSHDIEDALTSNLITPEDLSQYLALNKTEELKGKIDALLKNMEDLSFKNRLFSDKNELIYTQISSIIVHYFIEDVCSATQRKMTAYKVEKFDADDHHFNERIVWFSDLGEDLCEYLESIISKKVLNSHEVTMFDQNGSNIVLALFRAYYKNPMLLHKGTLQRIWNEFRKQNLYVVSFEEGKTEIIRGEWEKITTMKISADEKERDQEQEDTLKKRCILVRGICDFISGMTDSYAINEYHKIAP